MKIILGLAGEIASGKGATANYIIQNYGGLYYRISDVLRDILGRMHLPENRINMQKMSQALRQYFGDDVLSKIILNDLEKNKQKIIVLDGIRRYSDIKCLVKKNNFKLIYIEATLENRFSRIKRRGDNPDDKHKTLKQFRSDHAKESEMRIRGLKKRADFVIDNNKDFNSLYSSIDEIMVGFRERKSLQKRKNVAK